MPARSSYAAGTPCWVDHAGPDPDAARAFYGPLFGWEFAIGGPETGHYTLARKGVKNVAGLVGIPVTGHPPAWTTYFATDDADELGARVVANGGTLITEPMQVGDAGSMLLWVDPLEVVAGGWQAGARIGAELVNEPGTVVWNELVTPNLDVAVAFYSALLPVTGLDIGDETFRYQTLQVDGREVCGVYEAPPGCRRTGPSTSRSRTSTRPSIAPLHWVHRSPERRWILRSAGTPR